MKKLLNSLSHVGVLGLALLALVIGTVVWMVERLRGRCHAPATEDTALQTLQDEPATPLTFGEDAAAADSLAAGELGD